MTRSGRRDHELIWEGRFERPTLIAAILTGAVTHLFLDSHDRTMVRDDSAILARLGELSAQVASLTEQVSGSAADGSRSTADGGG